MKITDEKLYELCQKYGAAARFWRQKFIGLLPEVNKRRLYEKKGFSSVFEFAFKLAGVSEEQVSRVLNLERKIEKMPELHRALTSGEVSLNKLRRIVPIVTEENQAMLLEQVKVLPQKAVETLVKDEKMFCDAGRAPKSYDQMGMLQLQANGCAKFDVLNLNPEVCQKLLELQKKGIDINEIILNAVEEREERIARKKEEIAKNITEAASEKMTENGTSVGANNASATSRYIPVEIKKLLHEEFGEKCSIATCDKPAKIIHHTQRYGLSRNHDPRFLAPLCAQHHAIAHSIDLKYCEAREGNAQHRIVAVEP